MNLHILYINVVPLKLIHLLHKYIQIYIFEFQGFLNTTINLNCLKLIETRGIIRIILHYIYVRDIINIDNTLS